MYTTLYKYLVIRDLIFVFAFGASLSSLNFTNKIRTFNFLKKNKKSTPKKEELELF